MKHEIREAWGKLGAIKIQLAYGKLDYYDAKRLCVPHLLIINEEMARIAKRFGKKPIPLTFTKVIR